VTTLCCSTLPIVGPPITGCVSFFVRGVACCGKQALCCLAAAPVVHMIRASAEQGLFLERKRPTRRDSGTPKGDVARAHVLIGGDWRRFSRAARLTLSQVLMRARLIIFSTYPDRTRGFLFVHHIPDGPLIANPRFFTLDRSGNGICSLLA
jgi:hypothetical protein